MAGHYGTAQNGAFSISARILGLPTKDEWRL
jgi:hypothetical protein